MKIKNIILSAGSLILALLFLLPLQVHAESELQEFKEMFLNLESDPGKTARVYNPKSGWSERTVYSRPDFPVDPIYQKAIDLGESALEVLEPFLTHEKDRMLRTAAMCISIIGGEKAKEILFKASERNDRFKPYLMICLASTGTREDVSLLLKTVVDGLVLEDNDASAYYAFSSLSLIRTNDAFGALQQLKGEGPWISPQASEAIARYEKWKGTPSYRKDEIWSVLMNEGMLSLDKNLEYFEVSGKRITTPGESQEVKGIWNYNNGIWSVRRTFRNQEESRIVLALDRSKRVPKVCFLHHIIARDGKTAVVNFFVSYRPLESYFFWAILKKVDQEWKLIFCTLSGVS